ncbi:MAG: hypothetical protein ACK5KQ_00230 [Anaerorhabdus sp.]
MKKFKRLFNLFSVLILILSSAFMNISAIEIKDKPEEIIINENEVTERYSLSSEEFYKLEKRLFGIGIQRKIGDIPERVSRSYGSFNASSAATLALSLLGLGFPSIQAATGIAGAIIGVTDVTVYYTSIYTLRREDGVLYVKQEWKFYSNSSRTKYITNYVISREYSDNGLD